MSAIDVDPMVQAMFGRFAVQVAFNYVVQHGVDGEADRAILLGTTSFANKMSFGGMSQGSHTLVLCDGVIRPRLVIASNHLRGCGSSGILQSGLTGAEPWLENGKIIINNL